MIQLNYKGMQEQFKLSLIVVLTILIMSASTQFTGEEPKACELANPIDIEYMEVPDFINQPANYIHYPEQLRSFWEKLQALKSGKINRVNIVHIGDSHLQAGYINGELRQLFQKVFGHAGPGLVFPYKIAKTNSPRDFKVESEAEWTFERNINRVHKIPIGLCGYSLRTYRPDFNLNISLQNEEDFFDKVTVFGSTGKDAFDLSLHSLEEDNSFSSERQGCSAGRCFLLDQPQTTLQIKGQKLSNQQKQFTLQGILLENSRSRGVLYSSMGVNGATYYAYNRSEAFVDQLASMAPDLIIISLGTNEAADLNMRPEFVQQQAEKLISAIKKHSRCQAILLVTPPDIYIRSRYKTKHGLELAEMMHDLSKREEHIAIWDFYEVMGGYGSINKWLAAKLANRDRIHYSKDGYILQGQLLFKAMMKHFDKNY